MRPVPARPLTIEPVLERLAGVTCSAHARPGPIRCSELHCDRAIAETLSRSRRTVQHWKRDGLTVFIADEIATALGVHPVEVWGSSAWNHAQLEHEHVLGLEELDA